MPTHLSSTAAEPLSLVGVLIAAGLLLVLSGLSIWLSLDLHRRLLTSACRCKIPLRACIASAEAELASPAVVNWQPMHLARICKI